MKRKASIETETGAAFCSRQEYLSAEEEAELSRRILAGEAAKKVLAECGDLSDSKLRELRKTAEDGAQAYEQLVLANEPRAVKFAMQTWKKNGNGLDSFEDYKQTAMKVICQCARTYDWRLGSRFGTYVHQSLNHEMLRENGKMGYELRVPEEILPQISALKSLIAEKGRAEAEETLGLSGKDADRLLLAVSIGLSLQAPVGEEEDGTDLGDLIPDRDIQSAEEICERIDLEQQIRRLMEALMTLPEEERMLLRRRMGFDGEPLPMRAFVGITAASVSGVQKKQIAAERHLRKIYENLPMAE